MALYPAIKDIVDRKEKDGKGNAGLWFVTLTVRTCEWKDLHKRIDELNKSWRNIYIQMKKTKNKAYVNGMRKLEINPNPKVKKPKTHKDYMYHAHYHVLIQGKNNAYELKRRWLKMHSNAGEGGQKVLPFDTTKGSLVEFLKYISKPVVSGEKEDEKAAGLKKENTFKSEGRRIAMGYIYDCLIGRRTVFSYGTVSRKKKVEQSYNEKGEAMSMFGWQFFDAWNSLEKEIKEIEDQLKKEKKDINIKELKKRKGGLEGQKRRIMTFLCGEGFKASRPIEETVWRFVNGNYINEITGDLLCAEEDVKEAALSGASKKTKAKRLDMYEAGLACVKKGNKNVEQLKKKAEEEKKKQQAIDREYVDHTKPRPVIQTNVFDKQPSDVEIPEKPLTLKDYDDVYFKDEWHRYKFLKSKGFDVKYREIRPMIQGDTWVHPKKEKDSA